MKAWSIRLMARARSAENRSARKRSPRSGEQRRSNYALQPMSKEAFIQVVTADQPDAPAYFNYDAVLNSEERPTLDQTLARVNPMTLDDVLALQESGAQILDTRDPAEFAAAHLAGSINIGLGGQYATWAGTVLDREHPIVIIADPGRENEAASPPRPHRVRSCGRIFAGWIAQPEIAPGFDGHDRAPQRAVRRRAFVIAPAAAGHRRSHAARARSETHRRKFGHSAQSSDGKSGKAAEGPSAAGLLRRRLPVVHRGEPVATQRIRSRQRNCRRHRSMGGGEIAHSQCPSLESATARKSASITLATELESTCGFARCRSTTFTAKYR